MAPRALGRGKIGHKGPIVGQDYLFPFYIQKILQWKLDTLAE
jgi:hypothetical protein